MKKFLLLGAFIAPFFVSGQTIYDTAPSVAKYDKSELVWKLGGYSNNLANYTLSYGGLCSELVPNDTYFPNHRRNRGCSFTLSPAGDSAQGSYTYDTWTEREDGTIYNENRDVVVNSSAFARVIPQSVCGEDVNGFTDDTFEYNNLCYNPVDLAVADTCDDTAIFQSMSAEPNICVTKEDGSICYAERVITVLFSPTESSACYINAPNIEATNLPPLPPPDTCEVGLDGFLVCSSDGAINNGFSEDRYCGSYNTGGGNIEVCYDKDNDSDMIPNHLDDDIDNDGIANTSDTDIDGDGIPNEQEVGYVPPSSPPSTGQSFEETNALLGQINQQATAQNASNAVREGQLDDLTGLNRQILDELQGDGVTGLTGEPSAGLTGFYTPIYENGFAGIWTEKQELFAQTPVVAWVESWRISVNGDYQFPEFCANVIHDFGCHSFNIDDRAFPFIRIVLILTALMYARRLVTGG
ncbi:MAG: hypothetical protein ACJAS1_006190 [Oleiphilaceae bacterium]|jgi:hypothetical protein